MSRLRTIVLANGSSTPQSRLKKFDGTSEGSMISPWAGSVFVTCEYLRERYVTLKTCQVRESTPETFRPRIACTVAKRLDGDAYRISDLT